MSARRARLAGSVGRWRVAEVRHHLAHELHRHRDAVPVAGTALGHADPAFAHAVFLDVVAFDALETDADAALERALVVELALGVGGEAIGRGVGHGRSRGELPHPTE